MEKSNRLIIIKRFSYVLYSLFILITIGLLITIIFSVYPSYILRANYGEVFNIGQKIGNSLISFSGFEKGKSTIWSKNKYPNPEKINQPLILTIKSDKIEKEIFLSDKVQEYVYHSPMMPDPYVTFALLPGQFLTVDNSIQQFRYREVLNKKKDDEIRIFITGGSTAWGALAPNNESTIGGFLEIMLNDIIRDKQIKVITAAAGAWNTTQERNWIFNRITEFEPDVIISYSGHNDIFDVTRNKEDLFNSYWFDGAYYFNSLLQYEGFNRGKEVVEKIKSVRNSLRDNYVDDFPRKTIKNIQIINAYLEKIKCSYLFVFQPIRKEERIIVQKECKSLRKQLLNFDKLETNFSYLDHSTLFDKRNDIFYDRCHLGDKGNKIIAEDLLKMIMNNSRLKEFF